MGYQEFLMGISQVFYLNWPFNLITKHVKTERTVRSHKEEGVEMLFDCSE